MKKPYGYAWSGLGSLYWITNNGKRTKYRFNNLNAAKKYTVKLNKMWVKVAKKV